MVRTIVKDESFLKQRSEPATKNDAQTVTDLLDTLKENEAVCVGMAANMIGVRKNIIVFSVGMAKVPMLNPVIVKKTGAYETEEGCLSLKGSRKTTRYESIEVEFMDQNMKKQKQTFSGYIAQIIQHEVDHCNGIVI